MGLMKIFRRSVKVPLIPSLRDRYDVIHQVLQELRMMITLRLSDPLRTKLAALAKTQGISRSELIRKCLDDYLGAQRC